MTRHKPASPITQEMLIGTKNIYRDTPGGLNAAEKYEIAVGFHQALVDRMQELAEE